MTTPFDARLSVSGLAGRREKMLPNTPRRPRMMTLKRISVPVSAAFAGLRIALGILFLIFAQYKVFGTQFTREGGFQMWIHQFLAQHAAYPFMVPILRDFVLPHATAIAYLAADGELAIGLSLISGLLVRVASVFGVIYMLTLLFSSNYPGTHAPLWEYFGASLNHSVLALCFAAFAVAESRPAFWRRRKRG